MINPKFTPGPWSVGHMVSEDNGLLVGEGGNDSPPEPEAIANAHLIASAPELYAACRIALEYWHSDHPNDTVAGEEARAKIEAALAKAEGRK